MKKKLIICLTAISLCVTCYSYAEEKVDTGKLPDNEDTAVITSDIFGKKGGYLHPFLSITELYTDNVYSTNNNTASDFATVLSPGIWLAVPGTRTQLVELNISSTTPGGLNYDIEHVRYPRRFQSYLFVASDFSLYSKESTADTQEYWAEGFIQYNSPGNLSIDLINQYADSHDERSARTGGVLDKFKNNLFTISSTYAFSDKFSIRADYANYVVNYDAQRNSSNDRTDNSFSGYFFFNLRPKYSLFVEYDYIDVQYDTYSFADNKSHRFYGGLDWQFSAKSNGRIQVGYSTKEFDNSSRQDEDAAIVRAQIRHAFTTKTSLELNAFRQISESYIPTEANDILTNEISVHYLQKITSKISADIELRYTTEDYSAPPPGGTTSQKDNFYKLLPSVKYQFKKWLSAQCAYIYSERDSNFPNFDYKNNTFLIRLNVSI
jgi:hypothetical protein